MLKNIIRVPKIQLAFCLVAIYASTLFNKFLPLYIFYLIYCVGLTVFFDLLFMKLKKTASFIPWAGVVSGIIIALLANPKLSAYIIVLASFLSMFSKHFLIIHGRHIFNPAAFGLFFSHLIFKENISWWGVSFQKFGFDLKHLIFFVILLFPAYVSVMRLRRYRIIAAFLIMYVLLLSFIGLSLNLSPPFDSTLLFFALVMLPEPMTSPNKRSRQIFYAVAAALISVFISSGFIIQGFAFLAYIPDPLIFSVLVCNFLFFEGGELYGKEK